MNPRLSRSLLAIAVSGALLTGSAVVGAPAFAADTEATAAVRTALGDPATDPTTSESTPTGSATGTTTPDGAATDPGTPETDPSTPVTEPSTPVTEPSTPVTEPSTPETEPSTPVTEPSTPVAEPSSPETDPGSPADTTAPVGSFSLQTTSLWIGQKMTLKLGAVSDDTSSAEQILRVVNWGDNTANVLPAGQAQIRKQYTEAGSFTVTVTLKDAAGNIGMATAPAATKVTVTSPGKFKLNKTTVWPGQRFSVSISGVPAGTTVIRLHWGDGSYSKLRGANQTVSTLYGRNMGKVTLRATFANANGMSSLVTVGTIDVKRDRWRPVVKVKKPSQSNRLKSWKYATGTVTDKGAGVPFLFVLATRISGNKVYCFTPKKTWKRVYNERQFKNCVPVAVKVSKGKWSLKLSGLKKGELYVDAMARDWGGNLSKVASVKAKITRS
ncbi:hypothetical protein [Couchioplanes caeruleus]|uniref:PKD domain-containing protein n=2 Tax=Couchioplanes caeruleus TaxID=56438 RepID=A0A1K0GRV5_9ACTN|nr:hypothetical protein [Couchioplanes caeruleus]OJF15166.1 hypothetical protein BG844_05955 [Couchioplanes caeruleus subsp. caeruleus]OJF15710.1 hypothetical protein BG844_02995 [Couchioplanes caeruleus subsp. caeruleus]ROP31845.1 hypothetical protein EDD30_4771 [Couchioplanes caeruleus]